VTSINQVRRYVALVGILSWSISFGADDLDDYVAKLTPMPAALYQMLASQPGRMIPVEELMVVLRNPERSHPNALVRQISVLRAALGPHGVLIEGLSKVGYRYRESVEKRRERQGTAVANNDPAILYLMNVMVDDFSKAVFVDQQNVDFSYTEFLLVKEVANLRGKACPRDRLLEVSRTNPETFKSTLTRLNRRFRVYGWSLQWDVAEEGYKVTHSTGPRKMRRRGDEESCPTLYMSDAG
jgi:DNA-binding response OmpR family regulator